MKQSGRRIFRGIGSPAVPVLAAAVTLAVYFQWIPYPLISKTGLLMVGLLGLLILILVSRFYPILQRKAHHLSLGVRRLTVLLGMASAGAVLLIGAVPLPDRYLTLPEGAVTVSSADGSPVRLTLFNTGTTDSLNRFRTDDGLDWRGKVFHRILLEFETGPGFGSARIIWDGEAEDPQLVDLFAESPGLQVIERAYPDPFVNRLAVFAAFWGGLSALFWTVILIFVSREPAAAEPLVRSKTWFMYALPMALVWGLSLLTLYPAIMTSDSLEQWGQAVSGRFSDWHPAIYALTMRPFAALKLSPAWAALTQLVLIALLAAHGIELLRRYGLPRWGGWGLALLFAFAPANLFLPITIWKDIPFAISLFGMYLIGLEIALTGGASIRQGKRWVWLGIAAVGTALYRHNGLPIAAGLLFLTWAADRRAWRNVGKASVLFILLFTAIRGPLYTALNVDRNGFGGVNQIYVQIIAAHLEAGTPATDEDRAWIEEIAPADAWVYDSCVVNKMRMQPGFDWELAAVSAERNLKTVLSLTRRAPWVTLRHFFASSRMIWQVQPGSCYLYRIGFMRLSDGSFVWVETPNRTGVVQDSRLPWLVEPLFEVFARSVANRTVDSIFWRPALLSWLTLLIAGMTALRFRRGRLLLIAAPTLLQCGLMMMISVAQDMRFQYGVILIGLMNLGALFLNRGAPTAERRA